MNDKEKIIRKLIRKESLRMIKESQASFLKEVSNKTEKVIEGVDESIIDVNEKKLEKLKGEEQSAIDSEDFSELKRIKEDQIVAIGRLVKGYSKKAELLQRMELSLKDEMFNIETSGSGVFKNQELKEFSNENFQKDWGLRIETSDSSTSVVKIADHNSYKIINTNIPNLPKEALLQISDLKIGADGTVDVFLKRENGGGYEHIKKFTLDNITALIKNPR